MSLRWVRPPSIIANDLGRRRQNMKTATFALGQSHAVRGEAAMKQNASWTDRTGQARQGLFGEAEQVGDITRITLGHTAPHGPFLELGTSRMAPRAIVGPTADTTAREATEDLIELAQRFGG
jgi:hypothetical protein